MLRPTQIAIPTLVRVKDGALDRLGIYLARGGHRRVAVLVSKGLAPPLPDRLVFRRTLRDQRLVWMRLNSRGRPSDAVSHRPVRTNACGGG